MLKQATLILLSLFIFSNAYSQATDLKEYGLRGHIKSITYYNLSFDEQKNKFNPSLSQSQSTSTLYFNEAGNIDSVYTYYKENKKNKRKQSLRKIYYSYEKNKKASYKQFMDNSLVSDNGTYTWNDNYSYTIRFNAGAMQGVTEIKLDKNFRELNSATKLKLGSDQVLFEESYKNQRDNSNRIAVTYFLDLIENNFYKCSFEYLKFDKKNNPTETIQSFPKHPEKNQHIIRTIEYYN